MFGFGGDTYLSSRVRRQRRKGRGSREKGKEKAYLLVPRVCDSSEYKFLNSEDASFVSDKRVLQFTQFGIIIVFKIQVLLLLILLKSNDDFHL